MAADLPTFVYNCVSKTKKAKKRCGWNWKAIHFYNNIEFSFAWYIERYSSALISRRTVFSSVGYLQYHHVARRGQTWLKCECTCFVNLYNTRKHIYRTKSVHLLLCELVQIKLGAISRTHTDGTHWSLIVILCAGIFWSLVKYPDCQGLWVTEPFIIIAQGSCSWLCDQ